MQVQRFAATDSTDAMVAQYAEDGVIIIENVIDPDVIARLNADLDPRLLGMTNHPEWEYQEMVTAVFGEKTRRLTGMARYSDAFVEVITNPLVLEVVDKLLLPNCNDYWLNTGMVVDIGPGQDAQYLHADEALWPHMVQGPDNPDVLVNCMVAVSDFTEENGATRVVPGSHRWTLEERAERVNDTTASVSAVMSAGSIAVFSGKTIHGGGANKSPTGRRRGLTNSYCFGWLRGEEGVSLNFTEERVRALPERARYLLGFGSSGERTGKSSYGHGAYEMADPNVVLYGGTRNTDYVDAERSLLI